MRIVGSSIGGKYEVRRVLGIGGMGAVYEAKHAYTGRRVAVKVLGPDFASSHEAVERFLQEAQAPSSIGHPNIVEVLDAGEDPDVGLYVVLEYLDGEDLESAVERGTIGLPALLNVVLQLLDALGAAHARGFVHRDIKPANIFLTKNRDGTLRAKLLDFGIAKNTARGLTVGNVVMGTPHYMAPEQAQGLTVDARADLWAVGAVLYHALAGVPPYDGDNPNVIMVSIIMNEPPSLRTVRPDLSRALLEVVDRALVKSLDARWPDAQQMYNRLEAAPELHGGIVKITSTMRNRAGAVSGMRASAPGSEPQGAGQPVKLTASIIARSTTGTLGPDDVEARPSGASPSTLARASAPSAPPPSAQAPSAIPDARSIVPSTPLVAGSRTPPAPAAPPAALPEAPAHSKGRAPLIVALAAVTVVAAVALVALAFRPGHTTSPAPVAPPRLPVAAAVPDAQTPTTAAVTDAQAPTTAAVTDAQAPTVAAALDAGEPEAPRGHGRHGRHARHGDPQTAQTTQSTQTAQTTQPTQPTGTRIGGLHIGTYNTP